MKKLLITVVLIILVMGAGCVQNVPAKDTTTPSKTTSVPQPNTTHSASVSTSSIPPEHNKTPAMSNNIIKTFNIDIDYSSDTDALIVYLTVEKQTDYIRVDGTLNLTIKDRYGFLIYNGTLRVHKTDFEHYTEEFIGLDDKPHNLTKYKARYILPHPKKGLTNEGYIKATLKVGNQILSREFLSSALPEMSFREKKAYFEDLYLRHAKNVSIIQTQGGVQIEIYCYGIYVNPEDLKEYLRLDIEFRNVQNYTIELRERSDTKLLAGGIPVESEDPIEFYTLNLDPNETIRETLLFPMEEISLNTKTATLKLSLEIYLPERTFWIPLTEIPANITAYPLKVELKDVKYYTKDLWGVKEQFVNISVTVTNIGDDIVYIPWMDWTLDTRSYSTFDSTLPGDLRPGQTASGVLVIEADELSENPTLRVVIPSARRTLKFKVPISLELNN